MDRYAFVIDKKEKSDIVVTGYKLYYSLENTVGNKRFFRYFLIYTFFIPI